MMGGQVNSSRVNTRITNDLQLLAGYDDTTNLTPTVCRQSQNVSGVYWTPRGMASLTRQSCYALGQLAGCGTITLTFPVHGHTHNAMDVIHHSYYYRRLPEVNSESDYDDLPDFNETSDYDDLPDLKN